MIRVCYNHFDFLSSLDKPRDPNAVFQTKPRFKGSLHVIMNLISDAVFGVNKITFNHTIRGKRQDEVIENQVGFTGCIKDLYENESDLFIFPNTIPLPPEANLDIFGVLGSTRIEFRTGYTINNRLKDGDLIDCIYGFTLIQWIMILFSLLFLSSIIILFYILVLKGNKISQVIFNCFSHFMSKNFIEFESRSYSNFIGIILLNLTLFSYFSIVLFSSLIQTELVSVSKPYVPYSYQDLLENTSSLIVFTEEGSRLLFSKSHSGSKENIFYNSIEMRLWKHHREEWFKENGRNGVLMEYNKAIIGIHGKLIFIGADTNIKVMHKVMCDFKIHGKDLFPEKSYLMDAKYPWVTSDPDSKEYLLSLLKRNNFKFSFKEDKSIHQRITRIFQMGFKEIWNHEALNHDYVRDAFLLNNKDYEIQECLYYSKKLKMPIIGHQSVKLANVKYLSIYFLLFILSALLSFTIELRMKKRIMLQKHKIRLKRIRHRIHTS